MAQNTPQQHALRLIRKHNPHQSNENIQACYTSIIKDAKKDVKGPGASVPGLGKKTIFVYAIQLGGRLHRVQGSNKASSVILKAAKVRTVAVC